MATKRRKSRTPGPRMHDSLLPQSAEYALRAMATLAALRPGAVANADHVAREASIPRAYVSKIMRRLVLGKLVTSRRGAGGGFVLARAASTVCFSDILSAAGGAIDVDGCVFGWGPCSAHDACPLHPAWKDMKARYVAWADDTVLADVVAADARAKPKRGRTRP